MKENDIIQINWDEIPEYSSLPKEVFEGEKTSIHKLLGKEIAILTFRIIPSAFYEGNYVQVQAMEPSGKMIWFSTSSKVLEKQLTELSQKDSLPIRAKIEKVKNYYTLV